MADATNEQILQLEEARKLVLNDAVHYSQIIPGILPIIGPHAALEIRRWGATFLAEGFASPILTIHAKETLGIQVLPILKQHLETPAEDESVVKSTIQTAASIYGMIFRHITNNPQKSQTWEQMAAIKTNILRRWDLATIGVRVCCIKFVQRVIQVQTPGIITDPRRPEHNEISLALVPRDHPLIPPPNLEAEASGLLDRLLNVFYEEHSDAVLIDATLNCLSILVRTRQSISNKIVTTLLNFNPLKGAHNSMTIKEKMLVKSMERTLRAFLMNLYRRSENSPLAPRIKQHVDRMMAARLELFDDISRKRGPPEPTDGLDNAKRARLGADVSGRTDVPPLPPGPVSVAQLYTLTNEEALKSFDVTPIPVELVIQIIVPVLQRINPPQFEGAVNAVRARFLELTRRQATQIPPPLIPTPAAFEEDDDDYEPEFEPMEDNEQILNALEISPQEDPKQAVDLALGPFKLPQPPPVTYDEAEQLGKGAISRVFSMMSKLDGSKKTPKPGLNRLAGSDYDKDAWMTVITRLATRACPEISQDQSAEDKEEKKEKAVLLRLQDRSLGDSIRETLWKYIVEDFRHRIDVAIAWLNEEWYNDRIMDLHFAKGNRKAAASDQEALPSATPNYEKWVLRVLDAIIPYLDANDKVLVRFLGEIPEVGEVVLRRVKSIARDPDRVTLAVKAIYYLVLFKPPAKEIAIAALVDLWQNYDDAKASVRPYLARLRPSALSDQQQQPPSSINGVVKKEASATPVPLSSVDSPAPQQREEESLAPLPQKQMAEASTVAAAG